MDRIARKRQLSAMLDALRLSAEPDAEHYDVLLNQLGIATNADRDILRSVLVDAVYECRRHGADETEVAQFLAWLGGYVPD